MVCGLLASGGVQGGSFTTVEVPGATSTTVDGVNERGGSVGTYAVGMSSRGFVRRADGAITTFDVAGSLSTYARGINDGGTVVGHYDSGLGTGGYTRGVDGTIATFVVPGAAATFGADVNNLGQIVGTYSIGGVFDFHGFIRAADGNFSTFDVPGASWTYAEGINDQGQVSGFYFDGMAFHGYLRASDGSFTSFDVPQSMSTFGGGLNNAGSSVGYSVVSIFTSSGFVSIATGLVRNPDGTMTSVVVPGSASTYVAGINDRGQIVGNYVVNGVARGFITAVPEPGGGTLLATGVLGLLMVKRRRRS
ncbi:hypothetical protein [Planctomyces sp. SH-PL62]|uniref:hypothetical protein n=1 Tax=Planctomyces sp. SH-PL62 TaxID=1636152 RepID=UPI0008395A3D|nr:hypothetical protein [Planctomyces sp. SH-PL62]